MFNFKTELDESETVQLASLDCYVVGWGFGYHTCFIFIDGVRV
jgi:hypothetical protein